MKTMKRKINKKRRELFIPAILVKNSSVPAVSKIHNSTSQFRKFAWILILVALSFLCIYHVHRFLSEYFKYPIRVTLKVERMNTVEFPSVTICNLNRVYKKYEHCLKWGCNDKGNQDVSKNYTNAPTGVALVMTEFKMTKNKHQREFLQMYYAIKEEDRKIISHQAENFISSCVFRGKLCSWENFIQTYNLRFGNCFTFVPPEDQPTRVSQMGPDGGLRLTLDYETESYLNVTHTVGGRIVISHPSEMPDPEEQGFTLSPGRETSISLRQTVVKRLPPPYKDFCWDYAASKAAEDHSPRECRKLCIQTFNYKRCGCTDPAMGMTNGLEKCNLTSSLHLNCLSEALKFLEKDSSFCYCPLACESTYYNELISYSKYPSRVKYVLDTKNGSTESLRKARQKFGMVTVFYSSWERKVLEQAPAFEPSELLSNLGGEFGIWLGMSTFALFELTEKILSLLFAFFINRIK